MTSLRSDIFSVSSVAHPLPSRLPPGTPPRAPTNGLASTQATTTSPSSFFSSPLSPRNHEAEALSAAEALYRQHYPKFASRRHLRDQSPNKPPRMSDSHSSSTISDVQLLTPPSVIRPLLALPEVRHHLNGADPPPPTPASQPGHQHPVEAVIMSPDIHMTAPALPVQKPPLPLATPLLRQTPERRSAPRRSLEMSPNTSSQETANVELPLPVTSEPTRRGPFSGSSNVLRPPLQSNGSESGRRSDTSVAGLNSLGLEIQHVESIASPGSASPAPPSSEVKENMGPSFERRLSATKTKASNPVSPPKMRSRIISMHTAPAAGRREVPGKDGWSSVEASRYTLGPREASYIVRKLSEEQRLRQQKERAAAREEAAESRGRSRVRKRAGSWGNSLAIPQSMICKRNI